MFYDTTWYCCAGDQSTTGHYAVAKFAISTAYAAGQLVRQLAAPTVGNERVFVVIVAGTSGGSEPAWTVTRGAKTTSGTVTFQECTGASPVNGDLANTANWTAAKAAGTPTLGAIIKRNSGASYQICSTAGTMGASEPAFSNTAGVTTTEGTTTWTCLGPVGNFTGGQAPHARLDNACTTTWFAAGNTVYVGDNHAEAQATAITIAPSGSAATTGKIIGHNHSGSYPPAAADLMAGATVSTTAAVSITFSPSTGTYYVYGVTFKAGVGASTGVSGITLSALGAHYYFDNCSFWLSNTASGAAQLTLGGGGAGVIVFNNCTVKFAVVADYISLEFVQFIWQNTGPVLASGSAIPTGFIGALSAGRLNSVVLEALDLSQLTGNLLRQNASSQEGTWLVKDCKLNAAMSIATPVAFGQPVQLVRCDSAATGYKSARYLFEGTETTETSITRSGGAADPTGQAQSRKIVTTADAQWLRPFKAEPYAIWNATTAANVTVTAYGTINAGALPNNDDIWLEVEYLGSSATPLGTIKTTTKATLLSANAAVASDGSTWNGGGSGAGWSPFKLVAVLSSPQPGMAGYIHARVRAAKVSTTYYIDPQVVLT